MSFDIDANGILNVGAKDTATGKSQNIKIEASSGLSEAESSVWSRTPKSTSPRIRIKNARSRLATRPDSAVFQAEKQLKDLGDKLSADSKAKIEAGVNRVKEALKGENTEGNDGVGRGPQPALARGLVRDVPECQSAGAEAGFAGGERMHSEPNPGDNGSKTAKDGEEPIDAEFEEMK